MQCQRKDATCSCHSRLEHRSVRLVRLYCYCLQGVRGRYVGCCVVVVGGTMPHSGMDGGLGHECTGAIWGLSPWVQVLVVGEAGRWRMGRCCAHAGEGGSRCGTAMVVSRAPGSTVGFIMDNYHLHPFLSSTGKTTEISGYWQILRTGCKFESCRWSWF